jgi:thymidylate synthase
MRLVHGESFAHVYRRAIEEVLLRPDAVRSPRGLTCREVTPLIMQFPVWSGETGVFESETRATNLEYLAGELLWYYHGMRDVETIGKYSKFWNGIANPDGTVNSAYGWLLGLGQGPHEEWRWAINSLLQDHDTRQAVMVVHRPDHHWRGNKDVPCTLNVQFSRRQEYIDMTVVMRSNDLWFGVPYDVPFFITLLRNACFLLGQQPGTYTHIALNMHAYEKNWPSLMAMKNAGIATSRELPSMTKPWVALDGALTPAFTTHPEPLAKRLRELAAWKVS